MEENKTIKDEKSYMSKNEEEFYKLLLKLQRKYIILKV